jgi:hypothetical protein
VKELRWVVGAPKHAPRFVRFESHVGLRPLDGAVWAGDRLLLPICDGAIGDTLAVGALWRAMLVRNGEAVALGIRADSLATLYTKSGRRYRLSLPHRP